MNRSKLTSVIGCAIALFSLTLTAEVGNLPSDGTFHKTVEIDGLDLADLAFLTPSSINRREPMKHPVSDIAFTPSVKAVQERLGSRKGYASMEQRGGWNDVVTPDLAEFIAERDTMFIATVNAAGQPYIQHRGGPAGFLKVLDEHTLGFADFSGNRQYISVGNLNDNPKAFIFLMDFANRRRIKIWGRAEVIEDDAKLRPKLYDADYGSEPERMFLFHVDAWDVNCPQHIKPRFTEEEVGESMQALHDRIAQLEAECRSCAPKD